MNRGRGEETFLKKGFLSPPPVHPLIPTNLVGNKGHKTKGLPEAVELRLNAVAMGKPQDVGHEKHRPFAGDFGNHDAQRQLEGNLGALQHQMRPDRGLAGLKSLLRQQLQIQSSSVRFRYMLTLKKRQKHWPTVFTMH